MSNFKKFKKHGQKWEHVLGLQDWDILYRRPTKNEKSWIKGCCAKVLMDRNAMDATIVVGNTSDPNLDVLHELLHLTLYPLLYITERQKTKKEDILYEEHRVIQRLIKLLVKE